MQKCPNCGCELPDGSVCPCAAPGPIEARPSAPESPAVAIIRSMGASGKFLTAAISQTLVVVSYVAFVALFLGLVFTMNTQLDPDISFQAVPTVVVFSVSALLALLPAVLLWLHYRACKRQAPLSTAALTVWKVLSYIRLVMLCVVAVLLLLLIPVAVWGFQTNGQMHAEQVPFMITMVVVEIVFMLGFLSVFLLHFLAQIRIIDRAKNMIATGVPNPKVSRLPMVLYYIQGGYGGFMSVLWLFMSAMIFAMLPLEPPQSAFPMAFVAVFPALGCLLLFHSLAAILFAVCLGQYRNQLIRLMAPLTPIYYYGVPQNIPGVPAYVPQPTVPVAPTQQMYGQPAVSVTPVQQPAAPAQPEAPAEPAPEDKTEE